MLRKLVAVTAGFSVLVGCSATDQLVAPRPDASAPALKILDGAGSPAFAPYAIDPSGEGLATATWKRYAGLPDESGVPQHALSLVLRDGASPEAEAGANITGVTGLKVPKEMGLDFITGGACSAEGGLQVALTTVEGKTITLDCAAGRFAASPLKGAKDFTRVTWSLGDLSSCCTIGSVKLWLTPTKRPNLGIGIDIGGLFGVEVQPGWPGLRVYVTDDTGHRVVQLDDIAINGAVGTVRSFGALGSGTAQFFRPNDVYVDDAGKIHVADSHNARLVRFDDMTGAGWTARGDYGCAHPLFYGCIVNSVVGDGRGSLLSHIEGGTVYQTSLSQPWRLFNISQFFFVNGSVSPTPASLDVFPDYRGRLYLIRQSNTLTLIRFNDDQGNGQVNLTLPPAPSRPATHQDRRTLFIDAWSRIYVADRCRITRFDDMTGAGRISFPATGCFNGDFNGPEGVGMDTFGRIYFVTTFVGVSSVHRMNDMNGSGLVVLRSFPGSRMVSIWVDDRTPSW
jgi:hypothetical protein